MAMMARCDRCDVLGSLKGLPDVGKEDTHIMPIGWRKITSRAPDNPSDRKEYDLCDQCVGAFSRFMYTMEVKSE